MAVARQASDPTGKGKVFVNRYKVMKKLGKGNYAVAWLCKDRRAKDSGKKVIKEMKVESQDPDETVEELREVAILRDLDHPTVIKFYDSFLDGDSLCIVCEYAEGGDLELLIKNHKKSKDRFEEDQIISWLIQILLGVQYLHDKKILHRDLKPGNLFMKKNMIKIGDFGISRRLMDTQDMASTFAGTPIYMSPELANQATYNHKSDIWAVGCILFEIIALKPAFDIKSWSSFYGKLAGGPTLPLWPNEYSQELRGIFELLCACDPKNRPSAGYVISQKYMIAQIQRLRDNMQQQLETKVKTRKSRSDSPDAESEALESSTDWRNKTPSERMAERAKRNKTQKGSAPPDVDTDEDDASPSDRDTLHVEDISASLVESLSLTLRAQDLSSTF